MERTLTLETITKIGETVTIKGWVNARRNMGKIVFLDIRDRSGVMQAVGVPSQMDEASVERLKEARPEWVVSLVGVVQERGEKQKNLALPTGTVELLIKELAVLSKAEPLPLDLEDEKIGLDVHLDHLPITLRTEKWRALFKIQAEIVEAFRAFLRQEQFTEFQAPKIVGEAAEGGADVFKLSYFEHEATLAQSPQLYKQIMVGVFERVFTIGNVYRAEKHATTRHLNEYTSLDLEMGMIEDHTDVTRLETDLLQYLLVHLDKTVPRELALWNYVRPLLPENVPHLTLREVQQIIKTETGVDHTNEPDLEPSEEKWIGEYAKQKYQSDFVFVTHYPTLKRAMYTAPDEKDPYFSKSFDLLFRGIEITSGAERISNYQQFVAMMKERGMNPDNFKFYLEAFQFGMPPEGGLAIGLERLTARLLEIDNVKYATLFPRDLNRIDLQLSPPEYKQ